MKYCNLLLVMLILGCTEAPRATPLPIPTPATLDAHGYSFENVTIDGMVYRVWFKTAETHHTGYCVFAVNLTKDKLEVEKLQREESR